MAMHCQEGTVQIAEEHYLMGGSKREAQLDLAAPVHQSAAIARVSTSVLLLGINVFTISSAKFVPAVGCALLGRDPRSPDFRISFCPRPFLLVVSR